MASGLLKMGRLGRPHGIKGEISTDWQGAWQPAPGDEVFIGPSEAEPLPARIASIRRHHGKLLIRFDGIDDRTEAARLTGNLIMASRTLVGKPEEDEAFAADLAGYAVLLEDGSFLGRISHVEFPAGQMIWAIEDSQGREILFPAEPCFIVSLDAKKCEAVIAPPPGLVELYRA